MAPPVVEQKHSTAKSTTTGLGTKTADPALQQLREQARTTTVRENIRTIERTQTRQQANIRLRNPRNAQSRQNHRHDVASETEAERREQRAIVAANQRNITRNAAFARNAQTAGTAGAALDPEALERTEQIGRIQNQSNANALQTADQIANLGTELSASPAQQSRDAQRNIDPGIGALSTGTEQTVKLLDLVGPEATLTFREKLSEVWVKLDESATTQLDVIARLPANLKGQTSMELLMVESPQGVHFVAFLKNKNDFEVLASFDRRSLLPDNPSRQLVEAGIHAYEQLDAVARGAGEKLEENVRTKAQTASSDIVLNELRKLCIQEKRRRSSFRRMIDYLVDRLDELDLIEQDQENVGSALSTEERLAKELGSELKEDQIASALGDNRPTAGNKIVFDDEDKPKRPQSTHSSLSEQALGFVTRE